MQEFVNFSSSKISWFRCGGIIKIFCIVETLNELYEVLKKYSNEKKIFIGAGSNVLFRDNLFDGVVIRLGGDFNNIYVNENIIISGACVFAKQVSNFAIKNSLVGAEFLNTIPGTIGGVLKMNAGCFGIEVKDIFYSAEILINNEIKVLSKNDIEFDYRYTNIDDKSLILTASFELQKADVNAIKDAKNKIVEMNEYRKQNQVIGFTCGSTFKNPIDQNGNKLSVWKLIDGIGMRGYCIGGAKISEKHCNFIINTGTATAKDIEDLINIVKEKVLEEFNIKLSLEIKII